MITIAEGILTPDEFTELRQNVGLSHKDRDKAAISIANSRYIVTLRDGELLVGMGRVMGDGAIYYTVNDIAVRREYQGRGLSKIIMERIEAYLKENTDENARIVLFAIPPADRLYRQFHFEDFGQRLIGMAWENPDNKN